ncbi:pseudouridine synthase [Leptothrix cholodnii SP-6]|uniref:Dual-specificity RNA pseudouridine synthase RluA n=1 Tax=Leptothrix cholodnii (strain ATCC 51168 / LMG 8142 / SP-6) TaxID=395495 RepID=B1Y046_LEPCP|nr:pseudouridine synthase [Leptothrix cholodnii SP-6]
MSDKAGPRIVSVRISRSGCDGTIATAHSRFRPLHRRAVPSEPLIDILHHDDSLLVVRKPAGLLSVPGRGEHLQDCVAARVQAIWPDALIVHRLDMATSGLMVMARGPAAQRALGSAFEHRSVTKQYVAVVAGDVAGDAGSVDLPLCADWPNRPRQKVDAAMGRPSLTHWRRATPAHEGSTTGDIDRTRLELEPVTGRSHQLRVHLLALGHPILGDTLYAPDAVQRMAPRLLLHASRIALPHPAGGGICVFSDPPAF